MRRDPTIAIRDCPAEIAFLEEIAARMTLRAFGSDPIARRAAAYAIQTISEAAGAFRTTGSPSSRRSHGRKSGARET